MVAFAGRQYAARSPPVLVADNIHTIKSFTLVSNKLTPIKTARALLLLYIIQTNELSILHRSLNSKRVPYKICFGRNLGALHAQGSLFA